MTTFHSNILTPTRTYTKTFTSFMPITCKLDYLCIFLFKIEYEFTLIANVSGNPTPIPKKFLISTHNITMKSSISVCGTTASPLCEIYNSSCVTFNQDSPLSRKLHSYKYKSIKWYAAVCLFVYIYSFIYYINECSWNNNCFSCQRWGADFGWYCYYTFTNLPKIESPLLSQIERYTTIRIVFLCSVAVVIFICIMHNSTNRTRT